MNDPLLGPHRVGQRVVIRRFYRDPSGNLVLAPSGGPALTDVVGVLFAWDALGTRKAVVQPDDGPLVSFSIDDVVAGKPVVAQPAVRLRISVDLIESMTARLWPSVQTRDLDQWTLRFDAAPVPGARLKKRANSCLAVLEPSEPMDELLEEVVEFYADRGLPPLLNVVADSEVEALALEAGWRPLERGEAQLRMGSLPKVSRALGRVSTQAVTVTALGERARAVLTVGGEEAAVCEAMRERDYLGVHNLAVAEGHRRKGHAKRLMKALLAWGAEQGARTPAARTVWLHVESGNAPALALYDSLGMEVHHTMRYLQPPILHV